MSKFPLQKFTIEMIVLVNWNTVFCEFCQIHGVYRWFSFILMKYDSFSCVKFHFLLTPHIFGSSQCILSILPYRLNLRWPPPAWYHTYCNSCADEGHQNAAEGITSEVFSSCAGRNSGEGFFALNWSHVIALAFLFTSFFQPHHGLWIVPKTCAHVQRNTCF